MLLTNPPQIKFLILEKWGQQILQAFHKLIYWMRLFLRAHWKDDENTPANYLGDPWRVHSDQAVVGFA